MSINALNGDLVGNSVTFNTKMVEGLYLYVKYTKGNETSVTLDFQINDEKHPSASEWFNIITLGDANAAEVYTVVLTTASTLYCVVPVPTPESADLLKVTFTYTGGSSGDIEVWANTTNKYA
jgi:hypothetical protein